MLCDLESWGGYEIPITYLRTKEYGSFIPTLEIEIEEIPDDVAPFTHCNLTGDLGENNWFTSDITAHLLAVDDFSGIKKISYRINDDIWQSVDYVNKELTRYITVNISTNGEHTLEYYSTDFQDNVESVKSKNIKIDKKSPSADITYNGTLGENGYYISEAVVVVSAQDLESGVKQISYIVNNNEEVIVEDDYAFVILNEGHHQIVFTVIDNAGNIKVLDPVKVSVDITPPETVAKIDYGATGDDSSVLVTLLAQDAISGVSKTFYKVDKVTDFKEYTEPFIVSGYGRHIVYFYSVDNAGLVEEEGYEKFIIKMDLFVRK